MKLLAWLLLLTFNFQLSTAFAATKIFLHDANSALGGVSTAGAGYGCGNGNNDHVFRLADTTQGTGTVQKVFAPTSTAPPCQAQTASGNGQYLYWVSPPISSAVTISGNINYSAGCAESATQLNGGFRFLVKRWAVKQGGIVSTIHSSADTTECGTSLALRTLAAAAPTATAMEAGDRLVFVIEVRATGSWGGNSTRTFTVGYDGTAGSTGDAFANFVDTVSFSADTNNAPPLPFTSQAVFPALPRIAALAWGWSF